MGEPQQESSGDDWTLNRVLVDCAYCLKLCNSYKVIETNEPFSTGIPIQKNEQYSVHT